jgi:hypothetical protein
MKVFLVPLGPSDHVLYCEPGERDAVSNTSGTDRGFMARVYARFHQVITAAEQSRLEQSDAASDDRGWTARAKGYMLRWVADRIAEQRLLWQLRHCDCATLVFPSDLSEQDALTTLRAELKEDGDRHRRWLFVDGALLVFSAALTLIPGPNVIAYYFAFRAVGHYLSARGARNAREEVVWTTETSPDLLALRSVFHLDPPARHSTVCDVASRLELPHLATFVERVALKGA